MQAYIRAGIFFIILIGMISTAHALTCGVGVGNPLIRLATLTNSHAEDPLQSNVYTNYIGCTHLGGVTFSLNAAGTPVLQLSTPTNAHAEVVGGANGYTHVLKVSDSSAAGVMLATQIATGAQTCDNFDNAAQNIDYTTLVHLGRSTNSHVEAPSASPSYTFDVCIGFDSDGAGGGGSLPDVDIIQNNVLESTGQTSGNASVITGMTMTLNMIINKTAAPAANYANTRTVGILSICDLSNSQCSSATTMNQYRAEITADGLASGYQNLNIFKNRIAKAYMDNSDYANYVSVASIPVSASNIIQTDDKLEDLAGSNANDSFVIDPNALGLLPGNYRFHYLTLPAEYNYTINPITNNTWETVTYYNSPANLPGANLSYFDFEVVDHCGNGTYEPALEFCESTTNEGCTNLACNATCDSCVPFGPGNSGTAGDVYVLKNISFPNVYTNGDIDAVFTIENKDMTLTNPTSFGAIDIKVIIRNSKGQMVGGFNPLLVSPTLNFNPNNPETYTLTIQNAGCQSGSCTFNEGETYTLYATVQPYDNVNPSLDEKITANNSGYKTFTTLEAPQTFSIPDSPWWMSALMVTIVLGWLFVSSRKNEE